MAVLRSWVGEVAEEDDLQERYDRLGNFDAVILETLRARQAVLVNDEPGLFVVDGLTINQTENLRSLTALIGEFETTGSGLDKVSTTTSPEGIYALVRADRER